MVARVQRDASVKALLIMVLYAAVATLGFTVLFNIRGKKMLIAVLGGCIGWFTYLLLHRLSSSTIFSFFIASLAVGLYSELMAVLWKQPATIFNVCAIIPLVPGSGMYYTMFESIQGEVSKSISLGLETISIAGAIAAGIALASSIAKIASHITGTIKKHNDVP